MFDTYHTEARLGTTSDRRLEAQQTVTRELEKLAAVTSASVLAILDTDSRVSPVPAAPGSRLRERKGDAVGARIHDVSRGGRGRRRGVPRVGAPLRLDDRDVGTLVLGTSLDNAYAEILADLARGHRDHCQPRSRQGHGAR